MLPANPILPLDFFPPSLREKQNKAAAEPRTDGLEEANM